MIFVNFLYINWELKIVLFRATTDAQLKSPASTECRSQTKAEQKDEMEFARGMDGH